MNRVIVVDDREAVAKVFCEHFARSDGVEARCANDEKLEEFGHNVVVIHPTYSERSSNTAQMLQERIRLESLLKRRSVEHIVALSNTAIYHPKCGNPGRILESRPTNFKTPNRFAEYWLAFEQMVEEVCRTHAISTLTVLRSCVVLDKSGTDILNRAIKARALMRFFGYDNNVQILDARDLARAIATVITARADGVFNVAPSHPIPLKKAMRKARVLACAVPWLVQKPIRNVLRRNGFTSIDVAEFARYSFTVSGEKIKNEHGFAPEYASSQAIANYTGQTEENPEEFDDFGLDRPYLDRQGRWLLRFAERVYWRIKVDGLEHVPISGGAVMIGTHRGFMPLDGVMLTHILNRHQGRRVRFLMHPSLLRFPVISDFLTKIGGVLASRENAHDVLSGGDLLGVFPEGIRGAFRMYKSAYDLDDFGRPDYVKFAMENNVPIVPFVFLGPAEAFPILGRVDWKWWKRITGWPFFPITLTWPLLPLPLPTKWKVRILPPIYLDENHEDDKKRVVHDAHEKARRTIERHLHEMRDARRVWF